MSEQTAVAAELRGEIQARVAAQRDSIIQFMRDLCAIPSIMGNIGLVGQRVIQEMQRLPDAIFVVDAGREQIAVHEARKLGIPVVVIVDTNCVPDVVDFVIPGNDDALRAIKLFTSRIAEAVISGKDMTKAAPSGNGGGPHRKAEGEIAATPTSGDVAPGAAPEAAPAPA